MAAKTPNLPGSLLDRAIAYIAPVAGRERMRARMQMALAGQWAGGSTTRMQTANWLPFGGSADSDMSLDRTWLRTRSRDLARNNPLARGALNTVTSGAVGTGLVLRSQVDWDVLGMTPESAQEWQRTTEREFRLWADSPSMCDAERTLDFYQLQGVAFRAALESGDVFAPLPMIERSGLPYALKVQLVEADRVCNPSGRQDGGNLFAGIERDDMGAPTIYHVAKRHPGGAQLQANEWTALRVFGTKTGRRNVVHLFDKLRPGQGRGVPYLSPVIETLKQIGDYTDGELRAALVASLFTVFVKAEGGFGLEPDATGAAATTAQKTGDTMRLGSGAIVELNPGDDISTANPGRPNTAFDPFIQALLRQVGAALEIPFELLIKHFSASYSASRAALLEAWRFYKGRRAWMASMFCAPVYEAWMDEAVARGRVQAPGYFEDPAMRAAYLRSDWVGDSPGQIDPLKEVEAAEKRLGLLLTTYADETTALSGQDWDDVIQRRAREERAIDTNELRGALRQPTAPNGQPINQPKPDVAPVDIEEGADALA